MLHQFTYASQTPA